MERGFSQKQQADDNAIARAVEIVADIMNRHHGSNQLLAKHDMPKICEWLVLKASADEVRSFVRLEPTGMADRSGMTRESWLVDRRDNWKGTLSDDEDDGGSTLCWAVKEGSTTLVNVLLTRFTVNVNAVNQCGRTALMLAACRGYIDIVNALLAYSNVDVNAVERNGRTALIFATRNDQINVVNALLAHPNVNVNAASKNGWTALMVAAKGYDTNIVNVLLAHPDVNVNAADENGWTSLILAALHGRVQVVKALLAHPNVDVNATNKDGWTAIMSAAQNGRISVVQSLLNCPNVRLDCTDTNHHETSLNMAIRSGHKKMQEFLGDVLDARQHNKFIRSTVESTLNAPYGISGIVESYLTGLNPTKQFIHRGVLPASCGVDVAM